MAFRSKQLKSVNLGILYKKPKVINPYEQSSTIYDTKHNSFYAAKPQHLLKKYARLITEFANSQTGRDYLGIPNFKEKISLLTPAGYHITLEDQGDKLLEYAVIYTRYPFLAKLEPALQTLDLYIFNIKDFKEALRMLHWILGLVKEPSYIPAPLKQVFNTAFGPLNPAAGANAPVDGRVARTGVDETLATIRAGAGNDATVTDSADQYAIIEASVTSNQFATCRRAVWGFDTSSLGTGATIDDATLSLFGSAKTDLFTDGTRELRIVSATPANPNNLVNSDYGNFGTTDFGGVDYASYSTSAYNDILLNASGEGNINPTNYTFFGGRTWWDLNNNFNGTWGSGKLLIFSGRYADSGSNMPKLAGNYTPGTTTSTTTTTSTSTTTTSTSSSTTTTTSTSTTTTSTSTSTSTSTTTTVTSTSTSTTTTSTSTTTTTSTSSSTTTTSTSTSTTMTTSTSTTTTSTSTTTSSSTSSSTTTSTSTTTTYPYHFEIESGSGEPDSKMSFEVDSGSK